MSTHYMDSITCFNSRSRPRDSTPNNPPTLPKVNDIDDLVKWVQDVTDALSCLLSKEPIRKKGSSYEGCNPLESSVLRFCTFCEKGVDLLQIFNGTSDGLAGLFDSVGSKPYSDIKQYSDVLLSGIRNICPEIVSARELYKQFSSQLKDLVRTTHVQVKHTQDLDGILQRLEAFWKVVATQLSDVLEHRMNPPDRDTSLDASFQWQEYQACLIRAMDVIRQSSDALKASVYKPGGCHQKGGRPTSGRGFGGFWSKLKRGWPFK